MGFLARLEQPRASATADQLEAVITSVLGTPTTKSGAVVTPDSAMRYSAVFACVRVLAEDVAKLPLILYRRLKDGGKERATDHPYYRLLHDRPNSWMSSFEFREMMQGHIELRGAAFAFKNVVRNRIEELIPIHPDRVTVRQDENFNITYEVRGDSVPFRTEREILHIRGLSSDGVTALSPIALHRESIGLGMATMEHGAMLFSNGAQPGGILEVPGRIKKESQERLVDSVHQKYGGENRFKVMVLEDGAKYHQLGMTSEDAQYLDTRKFQRSEIASIFRVPPHKIGDLERATFSNIEAQERQYVQDSLAGRLVRWEQRLNLSLLSAAEQREYFFAFLTEGLLRGLTKERYEAYNLALNGGWMNRNEVRKREDLNPVDGLDEFLRPLNMGENSKSANEGVAVGDEAE